MKILQVNNVYGEKSTGKITKEIHDGLLRAGHEAVSAFGRGTARSGENVIRLCPEWYGKLNALRARVTGIPYGGCFFSTLRLQRLIRKEKPDVVHLQCINGDFVNIYRLVGWLKKSRIKTVVSLHAEFMYTANCGHAFDCNQWKQGCRKCPDPKKAVKSWFFDRTGHSWKKMRDAFSGFEKDCVICPVSPWTEARAKQSDILKDFSFRTIYNGINTAEIFRPDGAPPRGEVPTVVCVTAFFSGKKDHPKGGWYLIELAKRMPDVRFVVAGSHDEIAGLPENLTLLGVVADQRKLADLYRQADLSVLVSEKETFSMPCAESLCCGTPVVGFRAGAPEQIALPEYSAFADFGDLDELERITREWLSKACDRFAIASHAEAVYSARVMTESFLDIYGSMLWN